MSDYSSEFERRSDQFASYLERMQERALQIAHGPCFIIFEERAPDGFGERRELSEAEQLEVVKVSEVYGDTQGAVGALDEEIVSFELPDDGWREDDSQKRFVQFSAERKWFCLDMPLDTLFRPEAEQILRDRKGFFYLRDRTEFTLYQEDVEGHEPFRKVYIYGDERSAAEDMAFIFFTVWRFPIDSRLYVSSAAFSGNHRWENGYPIV